MLTNPRVNTAQSEDHVVSKMDGITLVPVAGQLIYPSPAPVAEDQRSHNLDVKKINTKHGSQALMFYYLLNKFVLKLSCFTIIP